MYILYVQFTNILKVQLQEIFKNVVYQFPWFSLLWLLEGSNMYVQKIKIKLNSSCLENFVKDVNYIITCLEAAFLRLDSRNQMK